MNPPPTARNPVSRRDFIKLAGLGFSSLVLPDPGRLLRTFQNQQGRVLEPSATVYDRPSVQGTVVKLVWKDGVVPIWGATVGDEKPEHNRIWYQVGNESYIHSSFLQPVQTLPNLPVADIPEGGMLGEITVPFSDAYWGPGKNSVVAYRFYYQTTVWVLNAILDDSGNLWYEIFEDKWKNLHYLPAAHVRLVSPSELSPLSPHVPPAAKRLEIHRTEQVIIALEWDRPVFMARMASGAVFTDGNYTTQPGRFITFHKRPSRHMARGNLSANGYDLPGVPWVTYFTESGVSIHGTYWHNDFGKPRSHGCINLTPQAARWIYLWCNPVVPANEQFAYDTAATVLDIF